MFKNGRIELHRPDILFVALSYSRREKYAVPRLLWKLALSSLSLMALLYSLTAEPNSLIW